MTLDGQGADELLAGYSGYPGYRIHSLLSQGRFSDAARFARGWSAEPGRSATGLAAAVAAQVVPRRERDRVRLATARSRVMRRPDGLDVRSTSPLLGDVPRGRSLAAVLRDGLTDRGLEALLRHADRNSMAFSVESRVPFLDVDVAEFLLTLPEDYLISSRGQTKRVLRAAMRGIVPDAILDRRDKIGFETPQRSWLKTAHLDLDALARGCPCVSVHRRRCPAAAAGRLARRPSLPTERRHRMAAAELQPVVRASGPPGEAVGRSRKTDHTPSKSLARYSSAMHRSSTATFSTSPTSSSGSVQLRTKDARSELTASTHEAPGETAALERNGVVPLADEDPQPEEGQGGGDGGKSGSERAEGRHQGKVGDDVDRGGCHGNPQLRPGLECDAHPGCKGRTSWPIRRAGAMRATRVPTRGTHVLRRRPRCPQRRDSVQRRPRCTRR